MIENALAFQSAGLSIMPIRADGSRIPYLPWIPLQRKALNGLRIRYLYTMKYPNAGTSIICGAVSGGLEVLDFDNEAETVFPAWAALVDSILCRLPVVETPSGGYHVYYRCQTVCGSKPIAKCDAGKILIETIADNKLIAAEQQKLGLLNEQRQAMRMVGVEAESVASLRANIAAKDASTDYLAGLMLELELIGAKKEKLNEIEAAKNTSGRYARGNAVRLLAEIDAANAKVEAEKVRIKLKDDEAKKDQAAKEKALALEKQMLTTQQKTTEQWSFKLMAIRDGAQAVEEMKLREQGLDAATAKRFAALTGSNDTSGSSGGTGPNTARQSRFVSGRAGADRQNRAQQEAAKRSKAEEERKTEAAALMTIMETIATNTESKLVVLGS